MQKNPLKMIGLTPAILGLGLSNDELYKYCQKMAQQLFVLVHPDGHNGDQRPEVIRISDAFDLLKSRDIFNQALVDFRITKSGEMAANAGGWHPDNEKKVLRIRIQNLEKENRFLTGEIEKERKTKTIIEKELEKQQSIKNLLTKELKKARKENIFLEKELEKMANDNHSQKSTETEEPKTEKLLYTEAYYRELQRLRETPNQDRLLTIGEAAARLQTSEDYLYRNWKNYPFARKLSRKQLRFSSRGIDDFLKGKKD
jgi:predicted DNA-binding transcriptional regulator AlpA